MAEEQKSKGQQIPMGRAYEQYLYEMSEEDRREKEERKEDRERLKRIEQKLDQVITRLLPREIGI